MIGPLLIRGSTVVLGDGLVRADILCAGGRVVEIGEGVSRPGAAVLDAGGLVAGPGFVDIHVHGGGGYSFFRPGVRELEGYSRWAPGNGVTSFLVSTAAPNAAELGGLLGSLAPAVGAGPGAEALGFHLEGPFLNPVRKGAFPARFLREPSVLDLEQILAAARGLVRQVTIAPELPGALAVIRRLAESGVVAALGHTDATFEEMERGFTAGASHVTHLFNAMRPLHQREGGPIAAALLESGASCELICDGAHVAPEMLRLAYALLGPSRAVVVTDNLELAGNAGAGGDFGGESLSVSGAAAVRGDGTIAGSVATMDEHVRNLRAFLGLSLPDIFRVVSANPARIASAGHRKGSLTPGFDADVVLLDEHMRVVATVCRGAVRHLTEPGRLIPAV